MSTNFEDRLRSAMQERAGLAPDVADLASRARAGYHRQRRRRVLVTAAAGVAAAAAVAAPAVAWFDRAPSPTPPASSTAVPTSAPPTRTWTLPSGQKEGDVATMGGSWRGELRADDTGCLFWWNEELDRVQNLRWPQGWSARQVGDGPVEVVNENGDVPYRSGTAVTFEAWFSSSRPDERCAGNQDVETTAIVVDWRGLGGQLPPEP